MVQDSVNITARCKNAFGECFANVFDDFYYEVGIMK